ncbi:MAG: sulfotransferase family 2 domain-containing protein [Paracoccaceae bacterium]
MLVFWRQRLVFLATPKTASTSIESALAPLAAVVVLRPPQLKHTNAHKYQRQVAPFLGDAKGTDFALTALMREPLDWLGSWYRYRQRPEEVPEKTTGAMTFDAFVQAYCQGDQPEFAKVGNQANFLAPNGHRQVDYIFRYERMGDFVGFLEKRLGTKINLPRENVSPQAPLDLSPATEALLRQVRARDFALYAKLE